MTILDKILFGGFAMGFFLMFCGVIIANIAVQQMRGVLNGGRSLKDQLRWHDAIQKVAQNVIDTYRASYPDGSLYRKMVVGYYMFGIGTVAMIGSAVMLKFVD